MPASREHVPDLPLVIAPPPGSVRSEDPRSQDRSRLGCPSCGSSHVAQVLGDNGGVSYVCTACGHSWS
ncbi:hypothetical protein ACPEIF_05905 [Streptomyces sp. NPDC012600]|uniref:Uncharacterized protein n=2 Tax=Streptomycetaceae TaxID=2062 RepID=A0ABU2W3P3_9ACTN|nr:hypothetical protein [Streptomyces griseus]ARF72480.1 hypothetical protein B7C62_09525 [Kitasatospora albolonga]MDT0492488.1 hypothetical protein [Streptomyces griseus]